jgi:hypothetical protein
MCKHAWWREETPDCALPVDDDLPSVSRLLSLPQQKEGFLETLNKNPPAASAVAATGGSVNGGQRSDDRQRWRRSSTSGATEQKEQSRLQNPSSQMTSQKDFDVPPEVDD